MKERDSQDPSSYFLGQWKVQDGGILAETLVLTFDVELVLAHDESEQPRSLAPAETGRVM